jgi:hypothetical protein
MTAGTDTDSTVKSYLYSQKGIRLGVALAEDTAAFCVDVSTVRAGIVEWIASCTFSTARDLVEVQSGSTQDPVEIEWGTEEFQVPAITDKDGNKILNTAGDPFDPPAFIDDSRIAITIRTTVSSVPSYVLNYRNRVNSSSFTIDGQSIAARRALVRRILIGKEYLRNTGTARDVSITMHLAETTWDVVLLDRGFRKLDPSDVTKRVLITNDDSTLPSAPVLLDGAGDVLSNPSSVTAVTLPFRVYKEAAFASNLPGCT